MTKEELNQQLNVQLQEVTGKVITAVKKYVDTQDGALKNELKEEIVKELSGVDGLGEKLEKIEEMANAFASVFDADEDGKITPEEILAKITALKSNIDAVVSDLDKFKSETNGLIGALQQAVKDLTDRIKALEVAVSRNADEIGKIKANIETNYFTKEDLEVAVKVNVEAIVSEAEKVLFGTDNSGDGAVL